MIAFVLHVRSLGIVPLLDDLRPLHYVARHVVITVSVQSESLWYISNAEQGHTSTGVLAPVLKQPLLIAGVSAERVIDSIPPRAMRTEGGAVFVWTVSEAHQQNEVPQRASPAFATIGNDQSTLRTQIGVA